jgi:hypothetical protein
MDSDSTELGTADSWQQLLLHKLTGSVLEHVSSAGTLKSERALGLGESVYFYVNAAHPKYGHSVILFRADRGARGRFARVSPFDTGGLAQGHIRLTAPLGEMGLRELLLRNSWDLEEYKLAWWSWVSRAFTRPDFYVLEHRPAVHPAAEVVLESCSSQAWYWELRILKSRYSEVSLKAQRVFVAPGGRRRFLHWLNSYAPVGDNTVRRMQSEFLRVVVESKNPVRAARQYVIDGKR